jgi:nicotinamide-nucleotide amidase
VTPFPPALQAEAARLIARCRARSLRFITAESCTGGLCAALVTAIAGASDIFEGAFVTYSNAAKTTMIGVPDEVLRRCGAVSEEVARAMAEGALSHSRADLAVSVTGIAGPSGGTPAKPVGLVHVAAARKGRPTIHVAKKFGDRGRDAVRQLAIAEMLKLALAQAETP